LQKASDEQVSPESSGSLPSLVAPAAVTRVCLAVGLATEMQVGRWGAISKVVELLPVVDQADDEAVIAAAVVAGLVTINTGPRSHSIKLTEAGLEACQMTADPERPSRR
jgi:hypothetical protein